MTGLDHQPAPRSTSALDLRIIFWSLLGRLADRREPLARRLDGLLSVVNMKPQAVDDERYRMEVVGTELTRPGESAVIDPRSWRPRLRVLPWLGIQRLVGEPDPGNGPTRFSTSKAISPPRRSPVHVCPSASSSARGAVATDV